MSQYPYDFYVTSAQFGKLVRQLEKSISEAPEGYLRESRSNGSRQLYRATSQDRAGRYIKKDETELLAKLIQKKYEIRCLNAAKKIQDHGPVKGKGYCLARIDQVYSQTKDWQKEYLKPYVIPTEQFVADWKSVLYDRFPIPLDGASYETAAGITVRSKSELIIANTLTSLGMAFRYEYPLMLSNGRTVRPDFLILDPWNREEVVYEHFGMMGNPDYAQKTLKKINEYLTDGYVFGVNFLGSFESDLCPLNSRNVKLMLEVFFQQRMLYSQGL